MFFVGASNGIFEPIEFCPAGAKKNVADECNDAGKVVACPSKLYATNPKCTTVKPIPEHIKNTEFQQCTFAAEGKNAASSVCVQKLPAQGKTAAAWAEVSCTRALCVKKFGLDAAAKTGAYVPVLFCPAGSQDAVTADECFTGNAVYSDKTKKVDSKASACPKALYDAAPTCAIAKRPTTTNTFMECKFPVSKTPQADVCIEKFPKTPTTAEQWAETPCVAAPVVVENKNVKDAQVQTALAPSPVPNPKTPKYF